MRRKMAGINSLREAGNSQGLSSRMENRASTEVSRANGGGLGAGKSFGAGIIPASILLTVRGQNGCICVSL